MLHVDKFLEQQYDCTMQELRFCVTWSLFFCTRAENKAQDAVSCETISVSFMSIEQKSKLIGKELFLIFITFKFKNSTDVERYWIFQALVLTKEVDVKFLSRWSQKYNKYKLL